MPIFWSMWLLWSKQIQGINTQILGHMLAARCQDPMFHCYFFLNNIYVHYHALNNPQHLKSLLPHCCGRSVYTHLVVHELCHDIVFMCIFLDNSIIVVTIEPQEVMFDLFTCQTGSVGCVYLIFKIMEIFHTGLYQPQMPHLKKLNYQIFNIRIFLQDKVFIQTFYSLLVVLHCLPVVLAFHSDKESWKKKSGTKQVSLQGPPSLVSFFWP